MCSHFYISFVKRLKLVSDTQCDVVSEKITVVDQTNFRSGIEAKLNTDWK